MSFEIRTTLLNPKYLEPLKGTAAGMNWIASRTQNIFASLTISNNKLDKQLGNQMTDVFMDLANGVTDGTMSAGVQSSLAHMFYLGKQGTWDADAKTLEKIANEYMNQVLQYGVACCHHTCKNLEFNMKIIQASSLTPSQKQQFAQILAQATNTDPLYEMEEEDQPTTPDNEDVAKDKNNAHELVNGTTAKEQSSDQSGGKTSAGQDMSETGDAKTSSQDASSSASAGEGASGSTAYELSQKSASKSASSAESSMPIFVIIAIIVLIGIFLVGYARDQDDEDYDDY